MSQPASIPDPETMNALIRMAHKDRSAAIAKLTKALYARLAARMLADPVPLPREWPLGRPQDVVLPPARS